MKSNRMHRPTTLAIGQCWGGVEPEDVDKAVLPTWGGDHYPGG